MDVPIAGTGCESGPVRTGTGTRPLLSAPVELWTVFEEAVPLDSTRQPCSVSGVFGDGGDILRWCWFTSSEETDVGNGYVPRFVTKGTRALLVVFGEFMSRVICAMLKFVEGDLFLALGLPLFVVAGLGCLFSTSVSIGLLLFPFCVSGLELTRLSIVKGDDLFLPAGGVALRVGVR